MDCLALCHLGAGEQQVEEQQRHDAAVIQLNEAKEELRKRLDERTQVSNTIRTETYACTSWAQNFSCFVL